MKKIHNSMILWMQLSATKIMMIIIQTVSNFSFSAKYYQTCSCTFDTDVLSQIQNHLLVFETSFKKSLQKMEKKIDSQIASSLIQVSIVDRAVKINVI